jgi:hypothetical protein
MAAAPWMRSVAKHLKEVRIHLCQTSGSSKGVRWVKQDESPDVYVLTSNFTGSLLRSTMSL